MYVYVSCLHFILQWNHLLINRDNKENFCLFKIFFVLFATASVSLLASPEAHESHVFVVRRTVCSVRPQAV